MNMDFQCELNKPICKRKAMAQKGSFEKKSCPTMQKRVCALAQPKCPLLPDEGDHCPIAKLVNGKEGENVCPLAPQGCPCDPCPPCPLAFEDKQFDDEESKEQTKVKSEKSAVPCPAEFPAFGKCPKTVDSGSKNLQKSCCPNVLAKSQDPGTSSLEEEIKKPYTPGAPLPELLQSIEGLKAQVDSTPQLTKKALTVPDCTLATRRPLPCSQCLGDLLSTPKLKINPKDCPYLKLIDMCDNTCLCEDVPSIDLGPPCPFAPKPCPCCAVVRCPLSRQPDCPLVSREPKPKCEPPPKCKCYCPIVPPSCASGMPILCKMHNNIKPAPCPLNFPKCKCCCTCAPPSKPSSCKCSCSCEQEERPKCPLVPTLYAECPLQPANQSSPFTGVKPTQPFPPPTTTTKKSKIPNVLVPPNVISSIENTLEEINKICTCDHPPSPQMVNMIPSTAIPSMSQPIAACIASGEHENCPIECLCEPPRTFHVPDCPKKNPSCLRSSPKGNKKGDMVCPFSPRCCPLGRACPFPVAAGEAIVPKQETKAGINSAGSKTVSNLPEEQTFMSSWCKEKDAALPKATSPGRLDTLVNQIKSGLDICTMIGGSNAPKSDEKPNLATSQTMMHNAQANQFKQINLPMSQNGKQEQMNKGAAKSSKQAAGETPSNCPLSKIRNGRDAKKKVCPFSPNPCPLDPLKPLSIREPKPCPFAPEPPCPLMPKPLCPAAPPCLMVTRAPLPECPYAPPGCPSAPKKMCFEEGEVNYDCPCPKPQPCPCSDPCCPCSKACPCPDSDPCCPGPNPSPGCPCPDPDPCCPCPNPSPGCPCPNSSPGCPCPNPSPGCPCDTEPGCPCPQPPECPLAPKTLCPLVPLPDPNCPLAEKNTYINRDTCPLGSTKMDGSGDNVCPCSDISSGCRCPPQNGACCPCPMLPPPKSGCPCKSEQENCMINKIIDEFRRKKKESSCPVKTPPCEKFPEGRCPMEDLGLCDCDYPCPPCMEPPQCGTAKAPPQYCANKDCCMGLGLPNAISNDRKFAKDGKPFTYYQFVESKPGLVETKYHVEFLDEPPNKFPFGIPQERKHPNWNIVRSGTAYEKCKIVAEKLKNRAPSIDIGTMFNKNDNAMDAATEHLMKQRKHQTELDKQAEKGQWQ